MDESSVEVYRDVNNSCYFSCSQTTEYDSPTIEFGYTVKPKSGNATGDPKMTFSTQVLMRNYRNR